MKTTELYADSMRTTNFMIIMELILVRPELA